MTNTLNRLLILTVFGLSLLRIIFILTTMIVDDEAYYYIYSKHLAAGYIDHGPMIAVVIKLFTLLFGDSEFGLRIVGIVLLTVLSIILYQFGKKTFNPTTGIIISLLVISNFLFHVNGVVITPDAPLMFFTFIAVMLYYKAFFENHKWFFPAGAILGLALLSKISALFLAIGLFLFPILSPNHRSFLIHKNFYLSFLIALAVFSPFIIWNLTNDLSFIRYQGAHISARGGITDFIGLWSALAILICPILFFYSFYLPIKEIVKRANGNHQLDSKTLYFSCVGIIPIIYFVVHSFFSRFEVNWPAPVIIGGIFLTAIVFGDNFRRYRNLFFIQIAFSILLILVITTHTYLPIIPVKGKTDITNRYFKYQAFKSELKDFIQDNPNYSNFRFASNNYQIPSMVNFYLKPEKEAICFSIGYHETLYSSLYPDSSLIGRDYLYIAKGIKFSPKLKNYFESVDFITSLSSIRRGEKVQDFSLWLVKNYKGKKLG